MGDSIIPAVPEVAPAENVSKPNENLEAPSTPSSPTEGLASPAPKKDVKTPSKKTFMYIGIIVAILIVIAVGFFAYAKFFLNLDSNTSVVTEETENTVVVTDPTETVTGNISALEKDVADLDSELSQLEEDLNLDIEFTL